MHRNIPSRPARHGAVALLAGLLALALTRPLAPARRDIRIGSRRRGPGAGDLLPVLRQVAGLGGSATPFLRLRIASGGTTPYTACATWTTPREEKVTHSGGNKPCMACNVCRDKRRKKVLHVAGEGGRPLCRSTRAEYPLVEGRFEAWANAANRCKACAGVVAKNLGRDWERKYRRQDGVNPTHAPNQ